VPTLVRACVCVVPSGSGVCVVEATADKGPMVLTVAHNIGGDSDDRDDEERRWGAGADDAADEVGAGRVGRHKLVVDASGRVALGRVVASDDVGNVALLELVEAVDYDGVPGIPIRAPTEPEVADDDAAMPKALRAALRERNRLRAPLPALRVATGPPEAGVAAVLLGNPFDWQNGRTGVARPRDNAFPPFHLSTGRVVGGGASASETYGTGGLTHTCWACWGHPGAPLVANGAIVGLHAAWDGERHGQRHAVSQAVLRAFMRKHLRATVKRLESRVASDRTIGASRAGAAVLDMKSLASTGQSEKALATLREGGAAAKADLAKAAAMKGFNLSTAVTMESHKDLLHGERKRLAANRAAVVVQRLWRARAARKVLENLLTREEIALRHKAVLSVQRTWRARALRARTARLTKLRSGATVRGRGGHKRGGFAAARLPSWGAKPEYAYVSVYGVDRRVPKPCTLAEYVAERTGAATPLLLLLFYYYARSLPR